MCKVKNIENIKKREGDGVANGVNNSDRDVADTADGARYTGDYADVISKSEVGEARGHGEIVPTGAVAFVYDP